MQNSIRDSAILCTLKRVSSYLLTTSDYGDSRPIRNGSSGVLQRDKFCAAPLEDPDAICVLTAAGASDLRKSNECAPA